MAKIKGENILQSWSCHLPDIGPKKQEYFNIVSDVFDAKKMDLKLKIGNFGSFFGKKQEYLLLEYNNYWAIIGAEALGTDLIVGWDLYTKNPNKNKVGYLEAFFGIDYNEITALRAFASVTADCAIQAADKIIEGTGINKDRINRKTSGSLGPL